MSLKYESSGAEYFSIEATSPYTGISHTPKVAPSLDTCLLFVRDRAALHRVCCSTIRVLRAEGNYVEVRTCDKRFVLRNSLTDVLDQLADSRFVQVNRNTVVNMDRVTRVDCDTLSIDGELITLSRNYRCAILEHMKVLRGR